MRKKKKTAIFLLVIDTCIIICFFLAYGPFSYLRELYITTAMTTMSHKYLARTIYTEDMINDVLDGNYVKETGESTNTNDIVIGDIDDSGEYDSIYDEQILTRDPAHPEYKLIPLKGSGYQGYMVAIYDPSRVELVMTNKLGRIGQFLRELVVDNQAILGMNAPMISYTYSSYLAIAVIAALDSVFGGITSVINKNFDLKIFVTGFFGNAILAILLTILGQRLNVDIYLAAIVVFVGRMFINLAIIRRYYVDKWSKKFEEIKNKNVKAKEKVEAKADEK